MKRRFLALAAAVWLCAGLLPVSSFGAASVFDDVSSGAWYYSDVMNAVQSGLVNGRSETEFCPDEYLTWAEAVKLAACMNQKYETGAVSLANGDPWYRTYADYALQKGIISSECAWGETITRAGYMAVFAGALPESALPAVNSIADGEIPDVPMTHPQAAQIYLLYRAGVVQGDEAHWCHPNDFIRRSEVAAILTRMMEPSERRSFRIGGGQSAADAAGEALRIVKNPVSCSVSAVEEETVSFSVEIAGGSAPYIYKWVVERETGAASSSGTSEKNVASYSVSFPPDTFDAGKPVYVYCIVTDSEGGSVVSEKAAVTPFSGVLRVTKQPAGCAVKAGQSASFTVEVAGGQAPYVYDWHEEIGGRTVSTQQTSSEPGNTLQISDAGSLAEQNGEITVYCDVTDSAGVKVTTDKVKMILSVMKVSVEPESVSLASGEDSFTLMVFVSGGTEPYSYQWYWGVSPDKLEDMSTWTAGYDSFSVTARPDDRFPVQYMSCRVRDAEGNEMFTPVVAIVIGETNG